MPYTRKTKSKNKRRTMKGGVRPRTASSAPSRRSSRSSSITDSLVNRETWIDLKKILENNNMFINLNLYHGNQFRNLLDDAVQVAKKFTDEEKKQIKKWVKAEKKKNAPVDSDAQITIWKEFLNNFSNRIK